MSRILTGFLNNLGVLLVGAAWPRWVDGGFGNANFFLEAGDGLGWVDSRTSYLGVFGEVGARGLGDVNGSTDDTNFLLFFFEVLGLSTSAVFAFDTVNRA